MADDTVVNIGQNSPEYVAYRLVRDVLNIEKPNPLTKDALLDLYADCLHAVKGNRISTDLQRKNEEWSRSHR